MGTNIMLWTGLITRCLSVGLLLYVLTQQLVQFKTHSFVQYLKPVLLAIGIVALLSNIVPIVNYVDTLNGITLSPDWKIWGQALNSLEAFVLAISLYFIYKTAKK